MANKSKQMRVDIRFYDYVKSKGLDAPEFTRHLMSDIELFEELRNKPKKKDNWGFKI